MPLLLVVIDGAEQVGTGREVPARSAPEIRFAASRSGRYGWDATLCKKSIRPAK